MATPTHDLVTHNGTTLQSGGAGTLIESDPRRWSFAVSVPLKDVPGSGFSLPVVLRVDLAVEAGQVGVGVMDALLKRFISPELVASSTGQTESVEFLLTTNSGAVMFRNTGQDEIPARFRILGIEIVPRGDHESCARHLWGPSHGGVSFSQLGLSPLSGDAGLGVEIISSAGISGLVGADVEIPEDPSEFLRDPLSWRMDPDDARILSAVYAGCRPQRHLEFGTWEGFGVVLCARSAPGVAITTVNLPEGESGDDGAPRYSVDGIGATDSGGRIGWRYRAEGLEDRVTQVLADTMTWHPDLPDGYFDSVLIDGGHASPVVMSDTELALRLTRPGGLIMWHDFCPVPRVIQQSEATKGVVSAVASGLTRWTPMLDSLAWVRPSFLLIGIRSARPWRPLAP